MSVQPASLEDWLALWLAPGVGARSVARLIEYFGSVRTVLAADAEALSRAGLSAQSVRALREPDEAAVCAALDWAAHEGAFILTLDDPRYPPLLAAIDAPPALLFVRGDPLLLSDPQLAVVGSRNPTRGGLDTAHAFAAHLAGIGLCVCSGLALGIDGAAHRGALETGRTVAVLGTGPDRVYPAAHRDLARRIAERGALVTDLPPGTGPKPGHFPRRNRLISALSLGTLVVEAAPSSGSLITARYAAEQGREVFAIPGSIHNPLARGCHALIREGAKLVDAADQILEELAPQLAGFATVPAAEATASSPERADGLSELDDEYRQLLDCLSYDPVTPDELIARSGLPAQSVASMLLLLELQGHVSSYPGGRYSLRGRP